MKRIIQGSILFFLSASALAEPTSLDPKAALNLDWFDFNVSPGNDFYTYTSGNWKRNNPIPSDYSSWGVFNIANEKVQQQLHDLVLKAAQDKHAKPGSIDQKVGDFFYSGMDEASINRLGIAPLKPEFDKIDNMQPSDLVKVIARLHYIGVNAFFVFGSMQDFKNSTRMIGAAQQGGLGLPDRDYYLNPGQKFQKIRQAYQLHISKMFELLGDNPEVAAKAAQVVMDIETKLAKASMTVVEQRDPYAVYNIQNKQQWAELMPNFSLAEYFDTLGLGAMSEANIAMPNFFKALNDLLANLPLADIKTYLRWHLLNTFASYLSQPFIDQSFKMSTILTGTEKILPRWKRVLLTENGILGFALGKLYVDKYFSEKSKQEVLDILKNIRAALLEDLGKLSWMSQVTRDAAIKKLKAMEERVGYPIKWWDYTTLKIDRGPYVMNVLRGHQFLSRRDLNKIGKPVDRTEWGMVPQIINAYYDPSMNNLNIPAGILQPPFFDPNAPAAVNYGAIGFVMGHEMTHGFDDQGAQFDAQGNLKNWWRPEDLAKFKKATQCIVEQFSKYVVDGDVKVQGKLVVGEAAADLGGLILAYKAFHRSNAYKKAKTIGGFTPDQQFFIGAAHVWTSNMRPEQERNLVTIDPHPPAQFRVNGTLLNFPAFQKAFSLPDDSLMVKQDRCVIW